MLFDTQTHYITPYGSELHQKSCHSAVCTPPHQFLQHHPSVTQDVWTTFYAAFTDVCWDFYNHQNNNNLKAVLIHQCLIVLMFPKMNCSCFVLHLKVFLIDNEHLNVCMNKTLSEKCTNMDTGEFPAETLSLWRASWKVFFWDCRLSRHAKL